MLSKLSGLQIGSGPVKGGFFNNDGTAFTGSNPLLNSKYDPTILYEGGRRPPSIFDLQDRITGTLGGQVTSEEQRPLGSGIGQLPNGTGTQMPLGGFPIQIPEGMAPIPEGGATKIGGPYIPPSTNNMGVGSLFNNQEFDQYLNSYVDNAINTRMKDIFGGIMSIFK